MGNSYTVICFLKYCAEISEGLFPNFVRLLMFLKDFNKNDSRFMHLKIPLNCFKSHMIIGWLLSRSALTNNQCQKCVVKNSWQPLKLVKLKFLFCKIVDWMSWARYLLLIQNILICKGDSEDEGHWKLDLISSSSWKFINVKIWNVRSTIVLVCVTQ